ncbi:hypothetical protein Ciccas_007740 [Cichlidogyrus casuarinus]|uniref:MIF4G-like type 2 domain-containing protein n=1 Tax=Cichlidogyrus casuarinus TaxID=1844966 RepID=A0ABD2Q641_9PLAT
MLIGQFCNLGIIEPEAVINWAYSSQMTIFSQSLKRETIAQPVILEFYVWECMDAAISRVTRFTEEAASRLRTRRLSQNSKCSSGYGSDTELEPSGIDDLKKEYDAAVIRQKEFYLMLLEKHATLMLTVEEQPAADRDVIFWLRGMLERILLKVCLL